MKDSLFISGAGYLWSVDIRKLSFLVVICICPLIHLSSCSISHMQYLKSQLRSLILIAFIGVVKIYGTMSDHLFRWGTIYSRVKCPVRTIYSGVKRPVRTSYSGVKRPVRTIYSGVKCPVWTSYSDGHFPPWQHYMSKHVYIKEVYRAYISAISEWNNINIEISL